jgi:signal transduction histidine kinase
MFFKQFYYAWLSAGIGHARSREEETTYRSVNFIQMLLTPIYLVFLGIYSYLSIPFLVGLWVVNNLLQLGVIVLMFLGLLNAARLATFGIGLANIFISVNYFGQEFGLQFFYLVTLSLVFVLYRPSEKAKIIFVSLVTVILYLINAMEWLPFPEKLGPGYGVSAGFFFHLSFVLAAILVWLTVGHFFYQNEKALLSLEQERSTAIHSAKMAALGEMAGGIAHEINNPLAVIAANVESQSEKIRSGKFDLNSVQNALSSVQRMTVRIAEIVRSLRVYARDGAKDPFVSVSVDKLLGELNALCEDRFFRHEILLVFSAPPGLFFLGREVQVLQILVNLLNNSFDSVKNLKEKWVKLEIRGEKDRLFFTITDSGQGIEDRIKEKIFQPFFTTKTVGQGTGLGLSLSQSLVEQHGGLLRYYLNSGHTAFVFDIPWDKQAPKRKPELTWH